MSNFTKAWSMFGQSFVLGLEETGRAIAEGTHEGFAWMADATRPLTDEERAAKRAQEAAAQAQEATK